MTDRLGIVPLICVLPWLLAAAPPEEKPSSLPRPILYRQHLMSEELIAEQGVGFLPMQRAQFEEAVRERSQQQKSGGAFARLEKSSYFWRLTREGVLTGEARLEVAYAGSVPVPLYLPQIGLAIGQIAWQGDVRTPVEAGVDEDGRLVVVVDRSGTLVFSCSLRGKSTPHDQFEFLLRLPPSPRCELNLQLASSWKPVTSDAIVHQPESTVNDSDERLWKVDLGPYDEVTLRLERENGAQDTRLNYVAESLSYRLTTAGLELVAGFRMDIRRDPLSEVLIELDPGLQIAAIKFHDLPVSRQLVEGNGDKQRYRLTFPEPQTGPDRELYITALAPMTIGTRWQLPSVRLLDCEWQTGQATLEIHEPLSLASLTANGCIGKKVEPLAQPMRGELRQFQCYSPDRSWEVQFAAAVQELLADTGLSLRFTESVTTGQFVADVVASRGEAFELRGRVLQGWIVDNVQTEPVENLETFTTEGTGQQILRIRLRQAVRIDQPTRLIVRGHRRGLVAGRHTPVENLRFFRLQNVPPRHGVVSVAVESPLRISVIGDQAVTQLADSSLSPAELSRLSSAPGAIVYRDVPAVDEMSLSVSPEQPAYSADMETTVRIDGQTVTEEYRFKITPERSHVARIAVRFSQSRETYPTWDLVGMAENSLSARRLDGATARNEGELWEVVSLRPMNTSFTIQAVWKSRLSGESAVALASVPEASAQTGSVQVEALDGTMVQVDTQNLTAVAIPRVSDDSTSVVRGLYRYVPSQDAALQIRRPPESDALPSAWIWLSQLSSRVSGGDDLEHEATLFLENGGLGSFSVRIPTDSLFLRAEVDGVDIDADRLEASGRLTIPLPKGKRFPVVRLSYIEKQRPFRLVGIIRSAWPTTGLKCLQRSWTIWTAPGFAVANRRASRSESVPWDKRLFGISLIRRDGKAFDLFSGDDWQGLAGLLRSFAESATTVEAQEQEQAVGEAASTAHPDQGDPQNLSRGWSRTRIDLGENESADVLVFSQSVLKASGCGLLLITCALLWWWGTTSPSHLTTVPFVAAILLLLVPAVLLPVCRGIFLGGLLANLLIRLRAIPTQSQLPLADSSAEVSLGARTVMGGVLLAVIFWNAGADTLAAQSPDSSATKTAANKPPVFPVLVPVDDKQEPLGDYVYLPRALFDELHRGTRESRVQVAGPLLASARYYVELSSSEDLPDQPTLRAMTAEYQLSQIGESTELRLPFHRDRVRVSDVRIDGHLVPFQWDDGGRLLIISLENPESRLLQLNLRPTDDGGEDFRFPIPVVPRARVTVRTAIDAQRIAVPTAVGALDRSTIGEVSADLGPANELQLSWQAPKPSRPERDDGDVAELLWLTVQPNSILVTAQIKYVVASGLVQLIEIEADPRLRLQTPDQNLPWHIEEVMEGDQRVLRCWFAQTPGPEATIRLTFLMSGGLGRFNIPHLRARAQRRAPPWLAVTGPADLNVQFQPDLRAIPMPPSEFAQAWGGNVDPPQAAMALSGEGVDEQKSPQITVVPRPLQFSADQDVEISVGYGNAFISYEAQYVIENGGIVQQLLRVPPRFEPREIIVIHDDINRLLRWMRVDGQTLALFFTTPLSGNVRIWLKGDVPLSRRGTMALPVVTVADTTPNNLRVKLFYQNDLQVQVVSAQGLIPENAVAPVHNPRVGRFLQSLTSRGSTDEGPPLLRLDVTPNQPQVQGSLVTSVSTESQQWWITASVKIAPKSGYVDTVRLRLPAEMDNAIEVTPPVEKEISVVPGEKHRLLVMRLPQPVRQEFTLRVRGRLRTAADESVRVPDIQLLDTTQVHRYLVLPRLIENRPASWETSGLQSVVLPTSPGLEIEDLSQFDSYEVVGSQAQAVLRGADRIEGAPEVHLADYRYQWFVDRGFHAWASFDVDPAGARELTLAMPDKSRLVHVTVSGVTVVPQPAGPRSWQIPVAVSYLPQRVEVLFHGSLNSSRVASDELRFPAPQLAGVAVRRTLWTIFASGESGRGDPLLAHTETSWLKQEEERLASAQSLWDQVVNESAGESPSDLVAWSSVWQDWIRQLEVSVDSSSSSAGNSTAVNQQDDWQRFDLQNSWSEPGKAGTSVIRANLMGAVPYFVVRYPDWNWQTPAWRFSTVMILLILVELWRRMRNKSWLQGTLRRYPYLLVGTVGFVWWAALQPSLAGLALLGLALFLAVRPAWRTKPA